MKTFRRVPFSWFALLVAPLPALCLASTLMMPPSGTSGFSVGGFLLLAALGSPFAYAGTVALAVCLHLLGKRMPVNRATSALCGLLLAAMELLPVLFLSWSSSGPDSGPPIELFPTYLARQWADPLCWVFVGAGLVTALVYDLFAAKRNALA
jgi:hypothetical protein